MSPALWVEKHSIKNESGLPIELAKRKFFWDIYNDLSPKQALLKPPQIGATVMSMLKSMWVAKKLRKDIIYTLPTQTDVEDIVGGSVNRIITQNPILRDWVKEHDTVQQKSIGDSLIRYRGTFSAKQATMVPSSLNIHDEVDNSDPEVLTLYETRLEAQEDESKKWRWYFSHPSLVGHGVDVYWQKSDMKEWYITCPHCNEAQVLSWPDNIDLDKQIYICSKCHKELSDNDRVNGEWRNVDGIPWEGEIVGGYEFSGWHVSQLMLWNKKAVDIINSFNDPQKDKQFFWNYVLGLPYVGSEDRIEPTTVLSNTVDMVNEQKAFSIIGADTGHGVHYCIMNKDGVFYFDYSQLITATKDPYDPIRAYLKNHPNSIAMFDQGGDLIGVRKLQAEFIGRVFLVFYRKDRKTLDLVKWGKDEEYGTVIVDRNRMLTLIVEQLRERGRFVLNGTGSGKPHEEWKEFADMFGNIYREKIAVKETREKDNRELYQVEYVWKRKGPDHFVHALLYAYVGFLKFGENEAVIIGDNNALSGIPKGRMHDDMPEETIIAQLTHQQFSDPNNQYEFRP